MVLKMSAYKYTPLLVFQFILLALYFVFVRYGEPVVVKGFEDTHVMIFIGFAYLMTFLKKYCYSALGFNWFLAALVVQWALLCQSFFHMEDNIIYVNKLNILEADIMSATVLITFGALLGLASGLQLLFISIVETAVAAVNFYLVTSVFKASDVGGSIVIHTFGAYFGLGASLALKAKKGEGDLNGPSYTSDVTAMIGSIFLWIYWPSFNSALTVTDTEYHRAVVNTYLSLAAATVTTFVVSSVLNHQKGKFDMVHVQNSTLAGGVAAGAICNMMISPGGAVAVGIVSGALSVVGYMFISPKLEALGIQDTCGVNNLHGMPGVFSGLLSILFAALVNPADYGTDLAAVFPPMGAMEGVTAEKQALNQFLALVVTLVISVVGGWITGFIAKNKVFQPLLDGEQYNDEPHWELPTSTN